MELKLWPVVYVELNWKRYDTNHHKPKATWKDALPDFGRFDWHLCRTETVLKVGEAKPRMPWRLWIYWKDATGTVHGRHFDWLWFPPRRWFTQGKKDE